MSTSRNTPSRQLPANPSLNSLKKQAKQLLKAHQSGEFEACSRFQQALPRFSNLPESLLQSEKFILADAQGVIACEYGFESWPKMKGHIQSLNGNGSLLQRIQEAITSGDREVLKALFEAHPDLQQKIQDAYRRKSQFLASLSHELNTPSAAIRDGVDSLLMDGDLNLSERCLENLEKVRHSTNHLTGLVSQVLDSRMYQDDRHRYKRSLYLAIVEAFAAGDTERLKGMIKDNPNLVREIFESDSVVVDSVVASMSHELRTPMNAIIGFTRLVLRRGKLSDRQRDILEKVYQGGNHLLNLINNLLDLAKLEVGRINVKPESLNVKGLIASCCSAVYPLALERGIEIWIEDGSNAPISYSSLCKQYFETPPPVESVLEAGESVYDDGDKEKSMTAAEKVSILRRHFIDRVPEADLCKEYGLKGGRAFGDLGKTIFQYFASYDTSDRIGEAHTDGGRLRQIVVNLLSNALKFTEKGEVSVHTTEENGNLIIAVSDTGTGIPADALDSIFEEFRQVEGSDPEHKGAGLGLPLTKRFTELLGGSISVQSEVGKGSTFTLKIPTTYQAV